MDTERGSATLTRNWARNGTIPKDALYLLESFMKGSEVLSVSTSGQPETEGVQVTLMGPADDDYCGNLMRHLLTFKRQFPGLPATIKVFPIGVLELNKVITNISVGNEANGVG